MKAESIVFAIAGMFFGVIVGWVLGTQQGAILRPSAPVQQAAAPAAGAGQPAAAVLDQNKVQALETTAKSEPSNATPRVQLANLYFDAERYEDAIKWYEAALKLDPKDVNVSTDLGVSYYYTNQPDRALAQFEHSLSIDPKHTKTLLNQGIVRAFGKQDLTGAQASWQQVLAVAPDGPEAQAAKRALDAMKSAHPGGAAAVSSNPGGAPPASPHNP